MPQKISFHDYGVCVCERHYQFSWFLSFYNKGFTLMKRELVEGGDEMSELFSEVVGLSQSKKITVMRRVIYTESRFIIKV